MELAGKVNFLNFHIFLCTKYFFFRWFNGCKTLWISTHWGTTPNGRKSATSRVKPSAPCPTPARWTRESCQERPSDCIRAWNVPTIIPGSSIQLEMDSASRNSWRNIRETKYFFPLLKGLFTQGKVFLGRVLQNLKNSQCFWGPVKLINHYSNIKDCAVIILALCKRALLFKFS